MTLEPGSNRIHLFLVHKKVGVGYNGESWTFDKNCGQCGMGEENPNSRIDAHRGAVLKHDESGVVVLNFCNDFVSPSVLDAKVGLE